MSDMTLDQKIVAYLQDAHAMEQNMLRMLDSMIATTSDTETRDRLREHRQETERQGQMLQDRLQQLGQSTSMTADWTAMAGAMLKGVGDMLRSDKPGQNARDGYVAEQMEIAAYELLERLAERAGDSETARIARTIRHQEEQMAGWIAMRWDEFVDQTLEEAGIQPVAVHE